MKKLLMKIEYGVGYLLSIVKAWMLLQLLHILSLFGNEEAKTAYKVARYKFHHL